MKAAHVYMLCVSCGGRVTCTLDRPPSSPAKTGTFWVIQLYFQLYFEHFLLLLSFLLYVDMWQETMSDAHAVVWLLRVSCICPCRTPWDLRNLLPPPIHSWIHLLLKWQKTNIEMQRCGRHQRIRHHLGGGERRLGVCYIWHNWNKQGRGWYQISSWGSCWGRASPPARLRGGRKTPFSPSGCFLLSFSFGPLLFAFLPLVEVRLDPAAVVRERDVDGPVGLSHGVDPLLHPLGVPFGHRWFDRGVGALEHSLPFGQRDLVLVFWTGDAQPAAKFLRGGNEAGQRPLDNSLWLSEASVY